MKAKLIIGGVGVKLIFNSSSFFDIMTAKKILDNIKHMDYYY